MHVELPIRRCPFKGVSHINVAQMIGSELAGKGAEFTECGIILWVNPWSWWAILEHALSERIINIEYPSTGRPCPPSVEQRTEQMVPFDVIFVVTVAKMEDT